MTLKIWEDGWKLFHHFTQPPILNHFFILQGRRQQGQKRGKGDFSKVQGQDGGKEGGAGAEKETKELFKSEWQQGVKLISFQKCPTFQPRLPYLTIYLYYNEQKKRKRASLKVNGIKGLNFFCSKIVYCKDKKIPFFWSSASCLLPPKEMVNMGGWVKRWKFFGKKI